jgi:hypothetical protein
LAHPSFLATLNRIDNADYLTRYMMSVLVSILLFAVVTFVGGCSGINCDMCTDQFLYNAYESVPDFVNRDILYGGDDKYYGVKFADGSWMSFSAPLNWRSHCSQDFAFNLPLIVRRMKLKNVVMFRTEADVYGDSIRFSYRSALFNVDVGGCMMDRDCMAARIASTEVGRYLNSDLFRICCLGGFRGR